MGYKPMKQLDLHGELAGERLVMIESEPCCYHLEAATPAHIFHYILCPVQEATRCIITVSRDYFDKDFSIEICKSIITNCPSVKTSVRLYHDFSSERYKFNCLLALGPKSHGLFQLQSKRLHSRSIEVIPCFDCEFRENESPEQIEFIRQHIVSTLNWRRTPSPLCFVRFRNARTGERTKGKEFILMSLSRVKDVITRLPDDDTSYVEVENYKKMIASIVFRGDKFIADESMTHEKVMIARPGISSWLDALLIDGHFVES